jgi:peptidoglycan/LPS O-acetylase OafA/YrhL
MDLFNPIYLVLAAGLALLLSIPAAIIFYRWWNRAFDRPAQLYRQLRRISRTTKAQHQAIMQQAAIVDPKRPKQKQIDWQLACRLLLDQSA